MMKHNKDNLSFEFEMQNEIESPTGYRGLAAFHKYWGKKPVEYLAYLVKTLTQQNEIVLDPFLGSGMIAREALLQGRKFIGIDINPIAVEMSRLLVDLPDYSRLFDALTNLEHKVKDQINCTYQAEDGKLVSHYLWDAATLISVWCSSRRGGKRIERVPTLYDNQLFQEYESYKLRNPRPLSHFYNARINTEESLTFCDLFTGRARRNIDILLDAIHQQTDERVKSALLLSLTSASGQMSRMVFAIKRRGKMTGRISEKIEVGSWIIGYWRPKVHFEINVWNCFYNRAEILLKALAIQKAGMNKNPSLEPSQVAEGDADYSIVNGDTNAILALLPPSSVSLIVTDPPHSDRIPYLEMSEMWNALLNKKVDFNNEIVVSNARKRNKTKAIYTEKMIEALSSMTDVLMPGRFLAVLFNARDNASWNFLSEKGLSSQLVYKGCLPMNYSANSVVQDNRKGSLKSDFILIYQKYGGSASQEALLTLLAQLPEWSEDFPNA